MGGSREKASCAGNWPQVFKKRAAQHPCVLSDKECGFLQGPPSTPLQVSAIILWLGDVAVKDMVNIKEYLNK